MDCFKKLEKFRLLDQQIRDRQTGTRNDLAHKLGVSSREIHNMIQELRNLGAEIVWYRLHNTYLYENDFKVEINVEVSKSY